MALEVQEDKFLLKMISILSIFLGVSYIISILSLIIIFFYSIYKKYEIKFKKEYIIAIYSFVISCVVKNYLGIFCSICLLAFIYTFFVIKHIGLKFNLIVKYSSYMAIFEIFYSLIFKTRAGYISFYNSNYYAAFLAMLIVAYYLKKYDKKYLATFILALIFTGSRFGILSLICAYILIIFIYNKIYGILLSLLAVIYFYLVYLSYLPFVRADTIKQYLDLRLWIYYLGYLSFKESYLFGKGIMYFLKFSNKVYPHSHNILIEVLNSFGILGTSLIIYIFKGLKVNKNNMLILFLVLVHGLADYTIFWPQTALLFLSLYIDMLV